MATKIEEKEWWQSRTVWTGALAALCGILHGTGLIPEPISNTIIDEAAGIILSGLTIYFRMKASKLIAPVITPTAPTA